LTPGPRAGPLFRAAFLAVFRAVRAVFFAIFFAVFRTVRAVFLAVFRIFRAAFLAVFRAVRAVFFAVFFAVFRTVLLAARAFFDRVAFLAALTVRFVVNRLRALPLRVVMSMPPRPCSPCGYYV
jgi:hypothetical protein